MVNRQWYQNLFNTLKENMSLQKDLLEPWRIKSTNIWLQFQTISKTKFRIEKVISKKVINYMSCVKVMIICLIAK